MNARFVLDKKKVLEQYTNLKALGLKVSYSFKTNRDIGKVLEELTDSEFSIHLTDEVDMITEKGKIWFFSQAWNQEDIRNLIERGVRNFVVDNGKDLMELLDFIERNKIKINLLLRMKFQEHRVGSGKYFVYGMPSKKVNEIISDIKDNELIGLLGVHVHRKSQNTSEWNIKEELRDSLSEESLKRINIINLGGGLPVRYKSYVLEVMPYIFEKIKEVTEWLKERNVEVYIEPGRFIAGPAVKLETEIIQVYDGVVVVNASLYNCALDTHLTETKMLVECELDDEGEEEEGAYYLIKGNSPTRDDIFRYKVKLRKEMVGVGEKIVFLNAGAYNYTTDFCGFKKLETVLI
ncbi:decarboxylase [Candidatus Woesearchaeota archaeon CG10_big_fil_rev_8_21_14_0_10_34_12]|nr:MAG: decarboxylase [Candidatus Woesearchaeota archaeon CG10_big_fil_rev_8_21_14_0_10_34_12]